MSGPQTLPPHKGVPGADPSSNKETQDFALCSGRLRAPTPTLDHEPWDPTPLLGRPEGTPIPRHPSLGPASPVTAAFIGGFWGFATG